MQLINGDPDDIRICRVEGESLVTIVIPREKLSEAKRLPKIPSRGVYFLLDEDHGNLSRVYAGQTTRGICRLEDHKAKKEFWNIAVMFLDDGTNIDRDVLDALEAKAIDFVISHGSYEAENLDAPTPTINPYKEETVENLHWSILFRMKVLGYDLDRIDKGPTGSQAMFHTDKNGIAAVGHFNKDRGSFIVHAGSQVNLDKQIIKNRAAENTRVALFGDASGIAVLNKDQEFPTPSAAAVFVLGGSQNGWKEWINSCGKTLGQVYRAQPSDL